MHKGGAQHFIETGDGFVSSYDFKTLRKYLMTIPDDVLTQDPSIPTQILHHLQKANTVLKKELPNIVESINQIKPFLEHDCEEDFILPAKNEANKYNLMILRYIITHITEYSKKNAKERVEALENQKTIVEGMIELTSYLVQNPLPISIRIQRIISPKDRTIYSINQFSSLRLSTLRRIANRYYLYVQLVPPPFRSSVLNKEFFHNLINAAVRKPETTYFPELPGEQELMIFLRLPQSPLVKENVIPYTMGTDPDSVKEWIDNATVIMAEYDQTEDEDRAATIAILMTRFLFTHTYPLLYPKTNPDAAAMNRRMEKFRNRSPNEIGILKKYIPKECIDKPVYQMFEIDSVGKAPLDWLRQSELYLTPIDAAYCIVKAHESLSIMAVLREMSGKPSIDPNEFAEKMPGFDDIFEVWLAFLSSAQLSDPKQLMSFVNDYSRLPGFSARVMASIAYLEASLTQFEQESE